MPLSNGPPRQAKTSFYDTKLESCWRKRDLTQHLNLTSTLLYLDLHHLRCRPRMEPQPIWAE